MQKSWDNYQCSQPPHYKYDRVVTFVYRTVGKNHQGLGCTDQQHPHRQENQSTSLGDHHHHQPHMQESLGGHPHHHRSILEPRQDHQPHMELKIPSIELLRPILELLQPPLHSYWIRRLRTVPGRRGGSTLRRGRGGKCQRGEMIPLTISP